MNYTTNLNLKKPAYSDPADVVDLNDNMDVIDSTYHSLSESESSITSKMAKVVSNNYAKTNEVTMGYVAQSGTVGSASSLYYTDKIPVEEGDVVQLYAHLGGAFVRRIMRFVCAYDSSGQAVAAKGTENTSAYTVPSGIKYVVLTSDGTSTTINQLMITRNYTPTAYEPYFEPYYLATEEFIDEAMQGYTLPEETVSGYNLISDDIVETGYYYGSSVGTAIRYSGSSSHKCVCVPVKPNTDYYVSHVARFWAFTDDDGIVTSFGELGSLLLNSGNGTKLYYTRDANTWNHKTLYGDTYSIIISEKRIGTSDNVKKPSFISGLSQNMMDAKFGCAMPKREIRLTRNLSESWYYDNILAIPSNIIYIGFFDFYNYLPNGIAFTVPAGGNSTVSNGYHYMVFDEHLARVSQQTQIGYYIAQENLRDCTALVIGDSTVAQNYMTQYMLDTFADKGKTLTLLGTRGTSPNSHEGRSGWSAYQYCTAAASGGVSNPFYNPSTEKFDFSYYMSEQGYSAPDFVVIQLGINDLYNASIKDTQNKIEQTASYVLSMVDSILAYNPNQKIILNLPTALNNDVTKHYNMLVLVRNTFVRYNDYIQLKALAYSDNNLRCSYCHLLLDPDSDILDDVHPKSAGYAKMAAEVINQINCWQN